MDIDRNSGRVGGYLPRPFGGSQGSGSSINSAFHSNFGAEAVPPPLDLSEFPSLSSQNTDSSQPNPMAGRQPYGQ